MKICKENTAYSSPLSLRAVSRIQHLADSKVHIEHHSLVVRPKQSLGFLALEALPPSDARNGTSMDLFVPLGTCMFKSPLAS